jgi:hypothetical protein
VLPFISLVTSFFGAEIFQPIDIPIYVGIPEHLEKFGATTHQ